MLCAVREMCESVPRDKKSALFVIVTKNVMLIRSMRCRFIRLTAVLSPFYRTVVDDSATRAIELIIVAIIVIIYNTILWRERDNAQIDIGYKSTFIVDPHGTLYSYLKN